MSYTTYFFYVLSGLRPGVSDEGDPANFEFVVWNASVRGSTLDKPLKMYLNKK